MSSKAPDQSLLEQMRTDWDQRARENARYYIATGKEEWSDEEFFESGRCTVREEILTDMGNICQGKDPKQMKVLEIGCGAGRITRALAELFGEVYAVDVSGEMVEQARRSLRDLPNAHVFQNSGADLKVLGDVRLDFAFSFIVFQHIPSRDVIESYLRDVHRLLAPGALFKFQVQGGDLTGSAGAHDTWLGVHFSEADARALAARTGFEARYMHGAGTQYFWLWYFRQQP
jgi:cyclopropane fatty-acyl-phospholipid synthase-like methyltransferase